MSHEDITKQVLNIGWNNGKMFAYGNLFVARNPKNKDMFSVYSQITDDDYECLTTSTFAKGVADIILHFEKKEN